jgi:hypothetical protein
MGSDLKRQLRLLAAQLDGDRGSDSYTVYHSVLPRLVDVLHERGFKLARAENIGHRHIDVIFSAIFEQGVSQGSVRVVWCALGYWLRWTRKEHLLLPLETYWQKYHMADVGSAGEPATLE